MSEITVDRARALLLPSVVFTDHVWAGRTAVAWVGQGQRVRPRCAACGSPRVRVLVADLVDEGTGDRGVTLAVCPHCSLHGDDGARVSLWTGSAEDLPPPAGEQRWGAQVQTAPDGAALHRLVELPDPSRDPEPYTSAIEAWQGAFAACGGLVRDGTRVGGYPLWLQGDDTPVCGAHGPMSLAVQIGADAGIDLGDSGVLYVFTCAAPACGQMRSVVQSH
ncbi:MAG: hypothetical protein ACI8PZ_005582 [Myxococcota bacterium]|jgi:hypothetical protein